MNNEIKEILEQLEWYRKIGKKDVYYPECVLSNKKAFILLDYITNLQQENEILKNDLENEIADNKLRWQEYNFFKNKYIEERTKNAQAIEYIKEHTDKLTKIRVPKLDFNYEVLLNILQNGSE